MQPDCKNEEKAVRLRSKWWLLLLPLSRLGPLQPNSARRSRDRDLFKSSPPPPLVFKVRGKELFVRALGRNSRPEAAMPLKTAPYWNVAGEDGKVCLGTAPIPEDTSVASVPAWESAFYNSEFTHVLGAVRLTTHPGGFVGLWGSLAGKKKFPSQYLTDATETLQEFIARER